MLLAAPVVLIQRLIAFILLCWRLLCFSSELLNRVFGP